MMRNRLAALRVAAWQANAGPWWQQGLPSGPAEGKVDKQCLIEW
jgi:hypothetical protein